jgi:hypothetical protein
LIKTEKEQKTKNLTKPAFPKELVESKENRLLKEIEGFQKKLEDQKENLKKIIE